MDNVAGRMYVSFEWFQENNQSSTMETIIIQSEVPLTLQQCSSQCINLAFFIPLHNYAFVIELVVTTTTYPNHQVLEQLGIWVHVQPTLEVRRLLNPVYSNLSQASTSPTCQATTMLCVTCFFSSRQNTSIIQPFNTCWKRFEDSSFAHSQLAPTSSL